MHACADVRPQAMLVAGMMDLNKKETTPAATSAQQMGQDKSEADEGLKIKIPIAAATATVGKAKLVEGVIKSEASDEQSVKLREYQLKAELLEERLQLKSNEILSLKELMTSQQAEHDAEKAEMRSTVNNLRQELAEATVKASNLDGQLLIMKELTSLTKETAANSMSILYDKLRVGNAAKAGSSNTPPSGGK